MAQAAVEPGAVVVADDGLHALADAYHYHDEQGGVGGEYSGGSHGVVAAVEIERFVDDDIDSASGKVDKRGGGSDAYDADDDAAAECEDASGESQG